MHVCMYVCLYVCMYVCMYVSSLYLSVRPRSAIHSVHSSVRPPVRSHLGKRRFAKLHFGIRLVTVKEDIQPPFGYVTAFRFDSKAVV